MRFGVVTLTDLKEVWGVGVTLMLPLTDFQPTECRLSVGAGEGIRTLDPDLGKVVLPRPNFPL